ncbi:MAG: hypothetical protein AABY10_06420 [Nanoarchaeota archaeon]
MNKVLWTLCLLAVFWSGFLMWKFAPPDLTMNLGLAEQQKVKSFEPVVYLDDEILPACSEDIETRVCMYSCAPDGICVFVPKEIIKKYNFKLKD